jgi:prepilin-type processing-associated H-X9-DG protein
LSSNPKNRVPRSFAFSLVELIVVVAIIGMLIAALFPVLARSREKARASACFSNYHQIGAAIQMYASDFEGDTPPDGGSFSGIITDNLPYIKNTDVFTCPDDFDRAKETRPGSYRMATLYQGKPINCGWNDPYSTTTPPAVAQSTTTTLLYEAEKDSVQSPIVPTYRHSGGAQILYFDGHAKWVAGTGKPDDDD